MREFSLFGEKRHLSPVHDLHCSALVSYTISKYLVLSIVITIVAKAFEQIPDGSECVLHSNQGWQYQHKQYQRMFRKKHKKDIRSSIAGKAAVWTML